MNFVIKVYVYVKCILRMTYFTIEVPKCHKKILAGTLATLIRQMNMKLLTVVALGKWG